MQLPVALVVDEGETIRAEKLLVLERENLGSRWHFQMNTRPYRMSDTSKHSLYANCTEQRFVRRHTRKLVMGYLTARTSLSDGNENGTRYLRSPTVLKRFPVTVARVALHWLHKGLSVTFVIVWRRRSPFMCNRQKHGMQKLSRHLRNAIQVCRIWQRLLRAPHPLAVTRTVFRTDPYRRD